MGSSGWSISLTPVPAVAQAKPRDVYTAVQDVVGKFWWNNLDSPWRDIASGWISAGEDSLLTVGDGDEGTIERVVFWLSQTVGWPQRLADHWLRLALAGDKIQLDDALRARGYALDLASVPSARELFSRPACGAFFLCDGRIGTAARGKIEWECDAEGDGELAASTYDALSDGGRSAVDEVLATGRCHCPLCRSCGHRLGTDRDLGARDASIEFLDSNDFGDFGQVHQIIVDGDAIVATVGAEGRSWAWLRRSGGRWTRDTAVARIGGSTRWLARDPRDQVWVTRTRNGQTLVSADGRTWQTGESRGLPDGDGAITASGGADVWVTLDGHVFRSTDAGRRFEELPRLAGSLYGWAAKRGVTPGSKAWLLECEAWTGMALPGGVSPEQVLVDGDAIVIFGDEENGETPGAVALRSLDGRTFSVLHAHASNSHLCAAVGPDGRWWWSVAPEQGGEPGLFTASSLDGSWHPVANFSPTAIFPDPAVPRAAWVADSAVLYRVTIV